MKFKIFFLNFLLFYFYQSCFSKDINHLIKAFQHIGIFRDNISLYFDLEPNVKLISKNKRENSNEEIYQVLKAKISPKFESLLMVKKINDKKNLFYEVKIYEKNDSIIIKIISDARFVKKIIPQSYKSISAFKGINFEIIHSHIKTEKHKSFNKPTIILDFGHGGKDSGTIGFNNIIEKNITLAIGDKLKNLLKKNDYNVVLTRNDDRFVALDQRTTFANSFSPSIFISIHANHSKNKNTSGIETHFFDSSLLHKFNFQSNEHLGDPLNISQPDLRQDHSVLLEKDKKNKTFALTIHENLYKKCKEYNKNLIDRKIIPSVSQVLLGTEMVAVLAEVGFLSNDKESELLCDDKYQETIAQGLLSGIEKYFSTLTF